MPLPKVYNAGTVSIDNGSAALTGTGTAWTQALVDGVFRKAGHSVRVASVGGLGAATLAEPWPGANLSNASYEIAITYDGPENQLAVRQLIEKLQNTFGLTPNVTVNGIADRAAYDDEAEGYIILVRDVGNGRAGFYTMGSGGSADWSAVTYLTGPQGSQTDLVFSISGKPRAAMTFPRLHVAAAITFPAGLAGSYATVATAPTAEAVFSLRQDGVEFATVTFAAASTTGVFDCPTDADFLAGDLFSMVAPSPADATLADLAITLHGTIPT